MKAAPVPARDVERVRALREYQILDTQEEALYDSIARLAAEACGAGGAYIAFVDERRQWLKAHAGIAVRETPREGTLAARIVATGETLILSDARADAAARRDPFVDGEPHVRFFAGVPLRSPDGHTVGALCAYDARPMEIDERPRVMLEAVTRALDGVLLNRRRILRTFDAAHIDMFALDPEDRTILFASAGACTRLGYALTELVGMPVYDVLPQLDESVFDDAVAFVRAGKPLVREATLRRRDGTTYPVELRIDASEGADRISAICMDRSEHVAAQREIDVLLRSIDAASDAVLVYSVEADGTLRLSYMNDAYERITGYSRDEAIGLDINVFRHAMPDDEGMRAIRGAIEAGESVEAELISYRKDGSSFWNQVAFHPVVESGRITRWISVERDISVEVVRTTALAEEHDRLLALAQAARRLFAVFDARQLVDSAKVVVRELLGAELHVLASNASGAAVEVQELGRDVVFPKKVNPAVASALAKRGRVVDDAHVSAVLYAGQYGDGHYALEVRVPSGRPLRSTDLFVLDLIAEYFAVAARNVALYHELDERRSAVLELSQTKSDLIAMLAHDFRGPLTSIVGYADLVEEVSKLESEPKEFLGSIKRAAMQLAELAADTLTFSRLERNEVTLQLADLDVLELIESVVEQYADRRPIEVHDSGDTRIIGDDQRLRQVFANLIDNAIKYSPGGEPVAIDVAGDGEVTVRVSDRGIGIPQGELSTIFDRFSRASNARRMKISGTGFGLFLAKQLVQLHGGTIAVDSREKEGSTFAVTLPRMPARSSAPRTVLLLDAERDGSFLGFGLREGGYRVRAAGGVDEIAAIADAETVDALVVNFDRLARDEAARLRAYTGKRGIPIVSVASDVSSLLGAAATVPQPVLAGDVMAALERVM